MKDANEHKFRLEARDVRRRRFGLLFLILAGGLLIWGLTWLRPALRGWPFVVYWAACFLLAMAALVTAWIDWSVVRRRLRVEQHRLLEDALARVSKPPQPPAKVDPKPGAGSSKPSSS